MLHIPAGMSNTYTYRIPKEHAAGRLLVPQPPARADDAARVLRAGGPARDRPHRRQHSAGHASSTSRSATWCCSTTPSSTGQAGSRSSTIPTGRNGSAPTKPPAGDELAKGTYRPLLAPVNFAQSKKGTQYFTVWYSRARCRSTNFARTLRVHSEQPAALRAPEPGGQEATSRPIPRCPTTSATCSSRSTGCSSR